MKGIISKVPVTISSRKGTKQGIVFITISRDERDAISGTRNLNIQDYEVIQNENPQPGQPLFDYQFIESNQRIRTKEDINAIWSFLAKDLVHTEPLEDQLDDLYASSLLIDNEQNPVRDSQPEDWELHTRKYEVAPETPEV